jgi:hypothetical protein
MSKLFDDLATLDKKIADRWKIRTRDNEKHVLSVKDVDYILDDVIKSARTTDITEKQGKAIVMMVNATIAADADKSAPAIDRIVYYVTVWEKSLHLNLKPFVRDDELQPIADFLGHGAVSRVMFKSPGTKIFYAPFDYIAVGELILNRDITVFQSMTGGLSVLAKDAAEYWHEANMLMIYDVEPRAARLTLVHEATHVIQDWEDVTSLEHHIEADAFIAEAVTELTLYSDTPETDDVSKTALLAAKMIIDKTAIDSNRDWQTAYENVVREVGKRYKKYRQRVTMVKRGEGASEGTKFRALLESINVANKIAEYGGKWAPAKSIQN